MSTKRRCFKIKKGRRRRMDMGEYSPERKSSCLPMIYSGIFRRKTLWPRRSSSTGALHTPPSNASGGKATSPTSKRRRGGSDDSSILNEVNLQANPPTHPHIPVPLNHPINYPRNPHDQGRKPSNATKASTPTQDRRSPKEVPSLTLSGELESMINDHQRSKGSETLVRASSGNVMLYGNLGNLRQTGSAHSNVTSNTILDFLPKTADEMNSNSYGKQSDKSTAPKKTNERENHQPAKETTGSLCRALSTRMDPEQLKALGNEDFKEGRFAEALALYEAAIAIDPEKAAYRSNKSAALTALGRLLEAVFECKQAIKIEPTYHRAHHRLATLYLRLGEPEKALYHYKQSGPETDPQDVARAQGLCTHLNKCTEAKRHKDWNTLVKVAESVISAGADSALQIFALKAEALLKIHRHEDADATMLKGPDFRIDDCTKFYGPVGNANIMIVQAQVDMALGRFEDAVEAAQRAAKLDTNNKDANSIVRRTRGVATARSRGNELFKASKFSDASTAYSQGLELDPYNSVLLCNRAACRSKTGQFEKAIEDCNKALNVRPSYSKARLRRADCNAKLERWEASIEDYEVLIKETPKDEEVSRSLSEAKAQLRKQRGDGSKDMKSGTGTSAASKKDRFRNVVDSAGPSVVLFCNKSCDKEETQLIEELSRQYQSVNFLKVDVDDNSHVAQSEGVDSLPVFRIYKKGSRMKDIHGANHELLKKSIQHYCS